eukprot:Unigene5910_Nuclearia_a/m.18084 Unigene5910_Nuclearia_a/g.18084  ORF Unigene5910_Nuclearia_a/g.18084 Unigene5910_Nuclearia_a/m.18084 type:complete len:448 (+) Unigene5910_Nuclearia_a:441-1784(+)
MRDGELERSAANEWEALLLDLVGQRHRHLHRALLVRRVQLRLHHVHHVHTRAVIVVTLQQQGGPRRPVRHVPEEALQVARLGPHRALHDARVARRRRQRHILALDDGHGDAEHGAALRRADVDAVDLGVVCAGRERRRVDADVEAASAVQQLDVLGAGDPLCRRNQRRAQLKRQAILVVVARLAVLLAEDRGDVHVCLRHVADLGRAPEVHAAHGRGAVWEGNLEAHVLLLVARVPKQVLIRTVQLDQACAVRKRVAGAHGPRRVLKRALDPVRRVLHALRPQRRQQQRDGAATVGRRHRRALHQLRLLQRPRRHGRDGAAGRAHAHAARAIEAWTARRPRVLRLRQAVQQRVRGLHERGRDVRAHADHVRCRARRRTHARQGWAVVAGRGHKDHALLVHKLVDQRHEPARVGQQRGLAVAEVDEVALAAGRGDKRAHERRAGLHRS